MTSFTIHYGFRVLKDTGDVMFLAGGNMKRGISEGPRTWGFLTVSLSDAEPALARPARRETEDEGRAEGERARL
jgi:hypothetical protein